MVYNCQKIVLTILFPLFVAVGCIGSTTKESTTKRNIPVENLREGDIAFRRGIGIASEAVLLSNKRGSYSHVGIIARDSGVWRVIHEVPFEGQRTEDDKICSQSLDVFFSEEEVYCGAIYRTPFDSISIVKVLNYINQHLDAETPFDHDYSLDDDKKLYCTELVWRAYLKAGHDLSQGRRTNVKMPPFDGYHIMPADIELNDSLRLIYSF